MPKHSGGKKRQKSSAVQNIDDELVYIPPRTEERLLIEQTASLHARKILCISTGRAQHAGFLADQNPKAKVVCHYLDTRYSQLAKEYWSEADCPPEILCSPDFPDETFEAVCIPVLQQGNAELNRELLQQAHQRLDIGGTLHAAINNPTDKWLHEQLNKIFPKVTRIKKKTGTYYAARKTAPLKKERNFHAEFSVKFSGQEMNFVTRPGIFSHRSLDDGTWALIKAMEIRSGMKVLDLGCGSGAVGIAALLAGKNVSVTAIDSDARAVQCTRQNADNNMSGDLAGRLTVLQNHTFEMKSPGKFDLVAINPPFFSSRKSAHHFITATRNALKKTGRVLFVTQMPGWYEEHLPHFFRKIKITQQGKYSIVQGRL